MSVRARELTARGAGAVSVVALAGPGALVLAARLARRALKVGVPELARLAIEGEVVDEALLCAASEEAVELQLHGGTALVRLVLSHLERAHGVELDAGPSAASLEEEALAALPSAPCSAAARLLLDQAGGALRTALAALPGLAPHARCAALDGLLERGRVAAFALRPARVLLAGPVNAGKSTLFNALVGRDRAITDAEPGTTRDVLTETVLLGAWPIVLSDTAGVRALPGDGALADVERAGQALAAALRARADLVLWLVGPGQPETPREWGPAPADSTAPVEIVRTQADRAPAAQAPAVSALRDPEGARRAVEDLFRRRFELPATAWTPGAAVPFADELRRDLAELRAAGGSGAGGAEVLAPWLAPGTGYRCRTRPARLR